MLVMVDSLSRALQSVTISACEGQGVVKKTIQALQFIRTAEQFNLFWKYLEKKSSDLDVAGPVLPCRRRVPRRFEVGEGDPEYPSTVEDHYKRIYFEVIDILVSSIQGQFHQKAFKCFKNLRLLLLLAEFPENEMVQVIIAFHGSDLNKELLITQLSSLHSTTDKESISDLTSVFSYLKRRSNIEKEYYSEVIKLAKLILVMPATNALSERSFSALRRIKTGLRSTIEQVCLNSCMVLHVAT